MYYALFVCIELKKKTPNKPITIPFIFSFYVFAFISFFNYENSKGSANIITPIDLQMKQLVCTY